MSNIYIYKAADGAGVAGGHALRTRGGALAVPSGCAGLQLVTAPTAGAGVVPSAVLWKEV